MEDIKAFRMGNLQIRKNIGRSEQIGFYTDAGGRKRRTMQYWIYYETDIGELLPDEWEKMMRGCVGASLWLQELFQRVVRYGESHWAWIRKQDEREAYTLDILAGKTYRHWDDFVEEFMQDGLQEENVFVFLFDQGG